MNDGHGHNLNGYSDFESIENVVIITPIINKLYDSENKVSMRFPARPNIFGYKLATLHENFESVVYILKQIESTIGVQTAAISRNNTSSSF